MDIVTGHVGSAHVTSWQDRDLNQGIFGPNTYILDVGSKMAASIITNNEIHIADGTLVMQGCQGAIQKGTYDTISIDNGSSGMKRIDLICAEYVKSGGVESLGWTVIKGTPAASNPSEPSYTSGDIQNGDTPVQEPIYRVDIDGLTVTGVQLYPAISNRLNTNEYPSYFNDLVTVSLNGSTTAVPLGAGYPSIDTEGVYIVVYTVTASSVPANTIFDSYVYYITTDGTHHGIVGCTSVSAANGSLNMQGVAIDRFTNLSDIQTVYAYLGSTSTASKQVSFQCWCYRIG